jgi:cytochrome c biogenesis protein CcdA
VIDSSSLSIAFVAGVLAAFNPCGFALLPAYLSVLVIGGEGDNQSRAAAYLRAARFSAGMALGLVAVFAAFALVVTPLSLSIEEYLPILTAVIGLSLLVLGVQLFRGKSITLRRFLNPNIAPKKEFLTQIGYGVTFALGSLSCTIGPFLAITSTALASGAALTIATTFSLYGLGMATVVLILALITAATNKALIGRIRAATPVIEKISAVLVFVVGIYITVYAWYEIQSYAGTATDNPIIEFALAIQGTLVQWAVTLLTFFNLI